MALDDLIAFVHVTFGAVGLIAAPVALIAPKANSWHRVFGKLFALSMTIVFVTAITLAAWRTVPFLFMLSFLSYYAVFAGVRITRLKELHKHQKPAWYDWLAGGLTGIAGLSFIVWGIYIWSMQEYQFVVLLALIFGSVTLRIVYIDLLPFIKRPKDPMYWWYYHYGNMLGGFAAALTAFLVTMNGMYNWQMPFLWVTPLALLAVVSPLLDRYYKKKFGQPIQA